MRRLLFMILVILLLAGMVLELMTGPIEIPFDQVINALRGRPLNGIGWDTIVNELRAPRAITAVLAGGGLAVCGLMMQTLFRNPLAGPSVLGITSGSSLFVALLVLGGGTILGMGGFVAAAFAGAMAVLAVILIADRRLGDAVTLLIVGLMIGYLCGALVQVLQVRSAASALRAFVLWGMGSFSGVGWQGLAWLAPIALLGMGGAVFLARPLNTLLLGEEYAASMGVHVPRVRALIMVCTGVLAGTITAFCGPIAFLGLAVPHVARGLFRTADHNVLIAAVILCGAVLAVICDLLTRLSSFGEGLPLNAVTSLLGAPVVLWVLLQGRKWYKVV